MKFLIVKIHVKQKTENNTEKQNTRNMRKIFKLSFLSIVSSFSFATFVASLQFA